MSVLVSDRTESKFEAITYSIELHDMLIDFMQRSFGVKDLDQLVRVRPITSIQIRDRIIRHVLCDEVLLPEVKKHIIYDNCASIKGDRKSVV